MEDCMRTLSRGRWSGWLMQGLFLGLLTGCGNAIDHFEIGTWQPAGEQVPARYPRGEMDAIAGEWLQELSSGTGREIALGDAVALARPMEAASGSNPACACSRPVRHGFTSARRSSSSGAASSCPAPARTIR